MLLGSDLQKFTARSWRERNLFVEAFLWLGVMRAAILLLPFRRIVSLFSLAEGGTATASDMEHAELAAVIGWAVRAASGRTPWESACLGQALAGMVMLRRRGIPGMIFLGVAKESAGPELIAAHSWLTCGKAILTGADGHERYAVISSFSWPGRTTTLSLNHDC